MPYSSQPSCRANASHALPSAWRAGVNTKINQPKPNNSVRASDVEQATFPVESDGWSTRLKRGGVVCGVDTHWQRLLACRWQEHLISTFWHHRLTWVYL